MLVQLVRSWTRQRGLLYAWINSESDSKLIEELWGKKLKNFVAVKEPNVSKITFYYDEKELNSIYDWVVKQTKSNPEYVELVKERFMMPLKALTLYLEGKKIESFVELRNYYDSLIVWRSPADSIFLIPDLEGVPETIKSEILDIRKKTHHLHDDLDKPIIDFIEERFPAYKELFDVLLPEELFSLEIVKLSERKLEEIKQRKKGCAVFRCKLYSLSALKQELKKQGLELCEEEKTAVDTITGTSAYSGKITGKVTLVLSKADYAKITGDSIVVTEMTAPDMVHVLLKAAAIITDEGGVTCHAAIIAREFKKPCIVGTKIATKALKEGDLVEVDAWKGTVRKIR